MERKSRSLRWAWGRFRRKRSAVLGLSLLTIVLLAATLGPWIYPTDPFAMAGPPFEAPFGGWRILGTDMLGRDIFAGILHGARTSLLIAVIGTACAVLVGTIIGGLAGFYGGRIDDLLMRLTEAFQTVPSFIFALVLVAILGPSITSIVAAVGVVSWPPMARLVRGEVLSLRGREFVEACVGLGMGDFRIIARHVLPNCLSSILVVGSLMIATAILVESGLSFLGLGDPNVMSWGFMIGAGRSVLRTAWWICAIPGLAILATVLAINLVGEGLNDALNPRMPQA